MKLGISHWACLFVFVGQYSTLGSCSKVVVKVVEMDEYFMEVLQERKMFFHVLVLLQASQD